MKSLMTLALGALLGSTLAGQAATHASGNGAMALSGKCSKLIAADKDVSKRCNGEVASVTFPDGTVMFIFSFGKTMVGFSGDSRKTVGDRAKGVATLPVNFAYTGFGKPTPMKATAASCRFGNPTSGKPAAVICTAKTAKGVFAGSFLSDGKPPRAH